MFILPSPVFCCLILHLPLHSVSSNNTLQVCAWKPCARSWGRGHAAWVMRASEWMWLLVRGLAGRVLSSVHLKLKSVGFPFTNGTCWCYSSIPSCKPSWFWSSITPPPPFADHFPPLPLPSPFTSHSLATHLPRHVMFSIDNILLDQTHINSVLMPAEEAVSSQPALHSWSATIPYRLPGPGPNYEIIDNFKKSLKM